jgi:hypothetical protein
LALFCLLCENRAVYDWLRSAAKFLSGSGVTFEKSLTSCHASSGFSLNGQTSRYCSINFSRHGKKTLHDFSTPSTDNVPIGPSVNTGVENFEIKTGRWCKLAHSLARPMRMLAHISSNSWNFAALLLSRELLRLQSDSDCSRFLF